MMLLQASEAFLRGGGAKGGAAQPRPPPAPGNFLGQVPHLSVFEKKEGVEGKKEGYRQRDRENRGKDGKRCKREEKREKRGKEGKKGEKRGKEGKRGENCPCPCLCPWNILEYS